MGYALARVVVLFPIAFFGDCALAQITPDGTLGAESSIVTPQAPGSPVDVIQGGATRGANLFHSFEQFSVLSGREAYFNNALDIQNIISRVTGGEVSNIDGLLSARGTANLFVINPNGIIFGPNASLNIGGSFVASTASSLNFADGTQFSATAPTTTPLLTVSVPIGLQYEGTGGSILNQSKATNSSGQVIGLAVQPGETLALLGGNVRLDGGSLRAPGGRVELGGVAGAGTVGLNFDSNNLLLSFPDGVARADVYLTNLGSNTARVDVAASNGGNIAITARNIDISGGSELNGGIGSGLGFPNAQAGDITLNAQGAIAITNGFIRNTTQDEAVGNGGGINVTTGSLSLTNGANLSATTRGQGNAGSVTINARDTVTFDGVGSNSASGAFSRVGEEAVGNGGGNGGDIKVTTGSLSLTNGANLSTTTRGQGNAGSVTINARDTVTFDGVGSNSASGAFSRVGEEAVGKGGGNGGDIKVTTGSLSLTNGAALSAATAGQGNAGSVTINARDTVTFDGVGSNDLPSRAESNVASTGSGNGGDIKVTTGSLSLTNGAALSAATEGRGNAGRVTINARDTVTFDGVGSNNQGSRAASNVVSTGSGNGGDIKVTTGSLSLTNGAYLSATTRGLGNAGRVTINARDTVTFDGVVSNNNRSGAFSRVGSTGKGNAGNIEVVARSIRLDNGAALSSGTTAGQGNISLRSQDLVLRGGSNITTNATGTATGGNITIDTGVIAASEDSDISANAEEAFGGQVRIDAQGIFGTQFQEDETPQSDITATSELGPEFSGTVEINTPDVDLSRGLVNLPAELVDVSGLIAQGCPGGGGTVGRGVSEFIITGRSGLPPSPSEALRTDAVRVDLGTPIQGEENRSSAAPSTNSTKVSAITRIVEAQGWVYGPNGEVILTAQVPTATLNIPWVPSVDCHTP